MPVQNSTETETRHHHFATVADAKQFALAGNATLTLESLKTGAHYTFKVREKVEEGRPTVHFVNLLRGPNNEADFVYMGIIRDGRFSLTKASRVSIDAPSWKAFNYFWNFDHGDTFPPQLVVHHEMKCGRCGRTLTVPSSIQLGIGPDCAVMMGLGL